MPLPCLDKGTYLVIAWLAVACSAPDAGEAGRRVAENDSSSQSQSTEPSLIGQPTAAGDSDDPSLLNDPAENEKPPTGEQALDPGECASDAYDAEPQPVVFSILLDQSGSMTEFQDRWTPVTAAIRQFVSSPQSEGLVTALHYFPLGFSRDEKCTDVTYQQPDVDFAPLPGNAAAIETSLDAHHFTQAESHDEPHRGTPTRPAIAGASQVLASFLEQNPEHRGYLLLATDGEPSKCRDSTIESVLEELEQAQALGIQTYVIGIGATDSLEYFAESGGTGTPAFIVDGSGKNTETEFFEALSNIRSASLPCDFALPQPEQGQLDLSKVNVDFTAAQTGELQLLQVESAAACANDTPTWFYSETGIETRISLCPAACETVNGQPDGRVELSVGCATRRLKRAK